jgi:hypothetical protein
LYQPPPLWQVDTTLIIANDDGHILWLRHEDEPWHLPGGPGLTDQPPWDTAVQHGQNQLQTPITLTNLSGVYPQADTHMSFAFTATVDNGRFSPTTQTAYFAPGAEPDDCLPAHVTHVADSLLPGDETMFRFLP